jgi:melibiose permease
MESNMESKKKLSGKEKFAYGIGAVGKDMVYMLSASYILYYYQDIMGVKAWIMGIILLAARVFDAFNDPIMGIVVAKTRTRWGKFRPWLFIGTLTNAIVLFFMFAAPPSLDGGGLAAYAAVTYILWGVTYTMMDIPYWSMVPAFTEGGKERENLSALARSCAGVGSAIISIITVMAVSALGNALAGSGASDIEIERVGFKYFALIIAIVFFVFIFITCTFIREKSTVDIKTASVGDMFKALVRNDQAMAMVITIVLVNTAVYITSNLLIYFFKYDLGGAGWRGDYTIFNTFGGGVQILAMMLIFPLLRKFFNTMKIFYVCIASAVGGYVVLLVMTLSGVSSVYPFLLPGFFIFAAAGILNVLVTIFLANTVDYGELKNKRRDESVIFSMQTFVVKLASGISALIASICLTIFNISSDENAVVDAVAGTSVVGLRLAMTLLPILVLVIAVCIFRKKYILTDKRLEEISEQLKQN